MRNWKRYGSFFIVAICTVFYFFPYPANADQTTMSVTILNGVPGPNTLGTGIGGSADRTQPTIVSLIFADITTSSVRVVWETSEPTMGVFRYGRTPLYEATAVWGEGYTSSHVILTTQLDPSAEYFVQITALDRAGNFDVKEGSFVLGPPIVLENIDMIPATSTVDEISEDNKQTDTVEGQPESPVPPQESIDIPDLRTPMPDVQEPDAQEIGGGDLPREPGSPESRPDTTSYTSAPPFVYVEEFDQVFGVESVEEIPKERLVTPEPVTPEPLTSVVSSSSVVVFSRGLSQALALAERQVVHFFQSLVLSVMPGSLTRIVVSFIFRLLF
ncbi:MAG: hypothetical protein A3J66_00630 [Candidatus Magasanikbacteria bacterium RIFCSPHIGHO2_02_FULL_47_14]|uniref:Fibronectin type-III domain-containing protein n=1 Tax=Candidatus Magasanikbacteria bacterium RIFCSPHIGHO2_02_FULL_47_14 TaxID=1798680 RepID=A0A1F6MAP8_9BACT|nr:MAG: hypothetical protein A3J66_00630 [Candidatus Magasanikbacteria bacterium RIFCSPHIGHO2_02_FULL_47_14]